MPELIDREQAGKNICKYCASNAYCKEDDCMVYQGLRDTPTIQIEAEPVRHGRWEYDRNGIVLCSVCQYPRQIGAHDFCGKCGARMSADHIADVSKKVGGADNEHQV